LRLRSTPRSGSSGKPPDGRPPGSAKAALQPRGEKINSLIRNDSSPQPATSCQLGFDRGTPGSFVGFPGSLVDSPGSNVDSSGSFAGFRARMSRYMTITIAYGA